MEKRMIVLKEKSVNTFVNNWKPLIDFLCTRKNKDATACGFDERSEWKHCEDWKREN